MEDELIEGESSDTEWEATDAVAAEAEAAGLTVEEYVSDIL